MKESDQKYEKGLLDFFKNEKTVEAFKELEKIEDKLDFMWSSPSLQEYFKRNTEQKFGKSEGESKRFREFGNKQFKIGNDKEAIQLFNKAICRAPVSEEGKGRDLSLAIANRSAALLKLGYLNQALEDAKLALSSGYPKELRYKLQERKVKISIEIKDRALYFDSLGGLNEALKDAGLEEEKSSKMLKGAEALLKTLEQSLESSSNGVSDLKEESTTKDTDDKIESQELGKSHSFLPCMSVDLDTDYSPARGRYVRADRPIPVGTVLLVESPISRVGREESEEVKEMASRCDACFSSIQLQCVPCLTCSQVCYCSIVCRERARGVHRWECGSRGMFGGIIDQVSTSSGRGTGKFTSIRDYSRLCFRALVQKPASWYLENKGTIEAEFPKFGDDSWDRSDMHSLLNLVDNHALINPGRLWSFLLVSLCHVRYLQVAGYFGRPDWKMVDTLTQEQQYLGRITVRMLELMQFNTTCILENSHQRRLLGNGLYPTLSLLNHGCDANVSKYWVGDKVVVVASKNISEGEEVTDCYFPTSHLVVKEQRKAWLAAYYWFDCECVACLAGRPTLEEMPEEPKNFCCPISSCNGVAVQTSECRACNQNIDVEKAKEEFEKIKNSLEELEMLVSLYPSSVSEEILAKVTQEWGRLQEVVRQPCRLLYTAEHLFLSALNKKYGNKAAV